MSAKHRRSKAKESRRAPAQWSEWSEWEWNKDHNCYTCYRCDSYGKYEWDYRHVDSENTNAPAQSSTTYASSSVANPQISVEDLNTQIQGINLQSDRESRGRKKSTENLHPERSRKDEPRDPTVSPSRDPKPGPKPPPFPIPDNSSSEHDSSAGYYAPTYSVNSTPSTYPNTSTGLYGSAREGEYDERSYESSSWQDYHANELQVIIRNTPFVATKSSSKYSFISSETVDKLGLKREKEKSWRYKHPDSRETYEIRDSVRTSIEISGTKSEKMRLFVISRKYWLKNPVLLGTEILQAVTPAAPADFSPTSVDSGYGTAHSRWPSINQPGNTSSTNSAATYPAAQSSYSSGPTYHQPVYAQPPPSGQEIPSSPYPSSSYPAQASPYYTPHDESYGSHHQNYAASTSSLGSGEGGMEDDFRHDDDHYTKHSDSHTTHSTYVTPRPTPPDDKSQNVYSSTSGANAYASDYVTR